jgi:hypothetical protein
MHPCNTYILRLGLVTSKSSVQAAQAAQSVAVVAIYMSTFSNVRFPIHIISRVKVYSEALHPIQTAQGLRINPLR